MWDLFHPAQHARGQIPNNPYKYRRPLPQIQHESDYGQVWQTAPYANDFQIQRCYQQPTMLKQVNLE